VQITKLDGHIRTAQPRTPQDNNFAALQLAAFQTLPAVRHSSPAEARRQYPALPSPMPRSSQQAAPTSGRENDQTAANWQHSVPATHAHTAADLQLRQSLAEPQSDVISEYQKTEPLGHSKEGWQAHERRLAALEASLLERANLASRELCSFAVTKPQERTQPQSF
jgi:hypothetical protein